MVYKGGIIPAYECIDLYALKGRADMGRRGEFLRGEKVVFGDQRQECLLILILGKEVLNYRYTIFPFDPVSLRLSPT